MSQIRSRLSLSELVALASAWSPTIIPNHSHPSPPPAKRQANKKIRWGNNVPHQGERECARRRGGQDWLDFRAADRAARGLPA